MSDLIPDGWTTGFLPEFVEINPKLNQVVELTGETLVSFIKMEDVSNNSVIKHKRIRKYSDVSKGFTKFNDHDVLVAKITPCFENGKGGYADELKNGVGFGSTEFHVMRAKNNFDSRYLYQYTNFPTFRLQAEASMCGTGGQRRVQTDFLRTHKSTIPPLPEQQKIAAILTSVDEVIEKTQAQIDKLKDLKTGMMQTLLTQGVGIDGKPHTEFKDSPVGRIPKGWEVKSLADLASFVTSGSRGWAQYYSESGAIFIRIGNLTREHINFRFKDIIYVTPPNSAEGKRTLVQTGDLLISITADLGVIAVVNDDIGEAYVNQHVSLVRLDDIKISRWVGHFLSFEESQKQFTANNDSGAKAGLNLTAIRNTKVALPPVNEMKKIVKTLDSLDSSILIKRKKLAKINDTKKALMQDLLTGKVRVNVSSEATGH